MDHLKSPLYRLYIFSDKAFFYAIVACDDYSLWSDVHRASFNLLKAYLSDHCFMWWVYRAQDTDWLMFVDIFFLKVVLLFKSFWSGCPLD